MLFTVLKVVRGGVKGVKNISLALFKLNIIQISGGSIHIKLTRYWCNWSLLLILANLSNDNDFSKRKLLARKCS